MTTQERAERLVKEWQRDCHPLADHFDLKELERRIKTALDEEKKQ